VQDHSDDSRPLRPTPLSAAIRLSWGMGGFSNGGRDEGDLSWTNEALPLEVRRALLDKALQDLRLARAAAGSAAPKLDRPGHGGSDRDSAIKKDKPQA
jgi:hypothetical protein